jgi:two-component sensor histidine kinase
MAIERQRIERELRGALDRQQMLLREVNHRVNNSLQIVGAMLILQGRTSENAEVKHHLSEASNRITAVARAHQRLYRTDQFTTIDLGPYLADVCSDFCEATPNCVIDVVADEHVVLSTDRAITVALGIAELITNVAKYAYPDGNCRTWITLHRTAESITVAVRDEGIGLPADFQLETSKGLGMRLLSSFTKQLQGNLTVARLQPGTEFTLSFPADAV